MLKIKLTPRGTKHHISYRIVVTESRSKYNGKFIDDLGFYTPQTKTLEIDKTKIGEWQKKGALLAIGVEKLLNPSKYPNKIKKPAKTKVEAKVDTEVEAKIDAKVETKVEEEQKS